MLVGRSYLQSCWPEVTDPFAPSAGLADAQNPALGWPSQTPTHDFAFSLGRSLLEWRHTQHFAA